MTSDIKKKLPTFLVLLGCSLLVLGMILISLLYKDMNTALDISEPIVVDITPGTAFSAITSDFTAREIIKNPVSFSVWARLTGIADRVQAGKYEIDGNLSQLTLLDKLVNGDVIQYQVTIVEGWTLQQALQALWQSEGVRITLAEKTPAEIAVAVGVDYNNSEGLFFPDTYNYSAGSSDLLLLQRANERMGQVLDQAWESRLGALPYTTAYDALIMASIVEKETAVASEREAIAGVFVRRLEQGMRLQSDPTVIYGLGTDFDGNLTRENLQTITDYNTYRVAGLPPTPIALPGRASIEASLNPAPGDALYFVARGDGSHYFSATLEEHNEAVRRFQQGGGN